MTAITINEYRFGKKTDMRGVDTHERERLLFINEKDAPVSFGDRVTEEGIRQTNGESGKTVTHLFE